MARQSSQDMKCLLEKWNTHKLTGVTTWAEEQQDKHPAAWGGECKQTSPCKQPRKVLSSLSKVPAEPRDTCCQPPQTDQCCSTAPFTSRPILHIIEIRTSTAWSHTSTYRQYDTLIMAGWIVASQTSLFSIFCVGMSMFLRHFYGCAIGWMATFTGKRLH